MSVRCLGRYGRVVVAVGMGVLIAAARVHGGTALSASAVATRVVFVAPVDRRGREVASDDLILAVHGACLPDDVLVPGPDYTCYAGDDPNTTKIGGPCWAVSDLPSYPDPYHHSALCTPQPWSTEVIEVDTSGLPRSTAAYLGRRFPWGLQLTTGQHCQPAPGTGSDYRGRAMFWTCDGNPTLWVLLPIHQQSSLWTVDTARFIGLSTGSSRIVAGPTVGVRTAWFGGWAPAQKSS